MFTPVIIIIISIIICCGAVKVLVYDLPVFTSYFMRFLRSFFVLLSFSYERLDAFFPMFL